MTEGNAKAASSLKMWRFGFPQHCPLPRCNHCGKVEASVPTVAHVRPGPVCISDLEREQRRWTKSPIRAVPPSQPRAFPSDWDILAFSISCRPTKVSKRVHWSIELSFPIEIESEVDPPLPLRPWTDSCSDPFVSTRTFAATNTLSVRFATSTWV